MTTFEHIFARLLTDPTERNVFGRDPAVYAAGCDLDAGDRAAVAGLRLDQLEAQAAVLDGKRLAAMRRRRARFGLTLDRLRSPPRLAVTATWRLGGRPRSIGLVFGLRPR